MVKINILEVTPPPAPGNLNIGLTPSGVFNITWTDQSTNELVFIVEKSAEDNTTFTAIDTLTSNTTSFLDARTENNKKYFYRVRAFNDAGFSPYSNVGEFTKIVTGIEDPANDIASVYPNPADDKLYVKSDASFPADWSIISMDGKVTSVSQVEMDDVSVIDLTDIPRGLYILQYTVHGELVRKKFMKK